jgi:hypothetical protein
MPNTLHNTKPSKAITINAEPTATLIEIILISRGI